jgi:hypothetical protein
MSRSGEYERGFLAGIEAAAKLAECGIEGHRGWHREDCQECQVADLIRDLAKTGKRFNDTLISPCTR